MTTFKQGRIQRDIIASAIALPDGKSVGLACVCGGMRFKLQLQRHGERIDFVMCCLTCKEPASPFGFHVPTP